MKLNMKKVAQALKSKGRTPVEHQGQADWTFPPNRPTAEKIKINKMVIEEYIGFINDPKRDPEHKERWKKEVDRLKEENKKLQSVSKKGQLEPEGQEFIQPVKAKPVKKIPYKNFTDPGSNRGPGPDNTNNVKRYIKSGNTVLISGADSDSWEAFVFPKGTSLQDAKATLLRSPDNFLEEEEIDELITNYKQNAQDFLDMQGDEEEDYDEDF